MSRTSFLDTIWARLIAGLVALAAAGALAYLNRDLLIEGFGETADAAPAECLEEQLGKIDSMIADGVVAPGKVAELRMRARQFCKPSSARD